MEAKHGKRPEDLGAAGMCRHPLSKKVRFAFILIAAYALSTGATARIERDNRVRHAFVKEQACPSTGKHRLPCPGYQIDHVWPLKCNGPDILANLQWLTIEEHKAKTKREAKECRK